MVCNTEYNNYGLFQGAGYEEGISSGSNVRLVNRDKT